MINYFKTSATLRKDIQRLENEVIKNRTDIIMLTGERNSWKKKFEDVMPAYSKLRAKKRREQRDVQLYIDRATEAEKRSQELLDALESKTEELDNLDFEHEVLKNDLLSLLKKVNG